MFDEVFGKISNENLEMVSQFFQKIKEYFEKIFVITHNPLVSQWADSVVKINKDNNVSKVEQMTRIVVYRWNGFHRFTFRK